MRKTRSSKRSEPIFIRYSTSDVGLMLRVSVFFKPSMFKEVGASSPEEVVICSELMRKGLCAPTPAVLSFLNLQAVGEGSYLWTVR